MQQEIWITIRLKGEADASLDPDKIAQAVLTRCQNACRDAGVELAFVVTQPGDVLEVEEEAEIYEQERGDVRT